MITISKFDIYRNRKTKYHPSIEISTDGSNWKNLEITHSPTKKGKYIELKDNPNKLDNKKSYVRKYIRNDKLKHRGKKLVNYSISSRDRKTINEYLKKHRKIKKVMKSPHN